MRKIIVALLFTSAALAADTPVDRWAKAVGGRRKIAAVKSIYREGTLQFGTFEGTIKVWHTADGRYRKEEQFGPFKSIETFDGTEAMAQKGDTPLWKLEGAELAVARSKAFANSNAMFLVFFPDRKLGTVAVEGDDTIAFTPDGGTAWHVTLDPQTSLPKTMVHDEDGKTVTVTFTSYETVDGITLEQELRRSMGDARSAVIHFTKTVLNAPVDSSMFTIK